MNELARSKGYKTRSEYLRALFKADKADHARLSGQTEEADAKAS